MYRPLPPLLLPLALAVLSLAPRSASAQESEPPRIYVEVSEEFRDPNYRYKTRVYLELRAMPQSSGSVLALKPGEALHFYLSHSRYESEGTESDPDQTPFKYSGERSYTVKEGSFAWSAALTRTARGATLDLAGAPPMGEEVPSGTMSLYHGRAYRFELTEQELRSWAQIRKQNVERDFAEDHAEYVEEAHGKGHLRVAVSMSLPSRSRLEARVEASEVERGGTLTLDGSSSTPAKDIQRYEWTVRGTCQQGETPERKLEGVKVSFTALCPVVAKLRVITQDNEASATRQVDVSPRKWRTPIKHRVRKDLDLPQPWDEPKLGAPRGRTPDGGVRFDSPRMKWAENRCALDHLGVTAAGGVIHPHGDNSPSRQRNGTGYVLARVEEPGSPFHGWFYVKDAPLVIDREAVFNRYILPDGPVFGTKDAMNFATANKAVYADWFRALEAHEGEGVGGKSRSGHTQIFRALARTRDPKREIEAFVGADEKALSVQLNKHLRELDAAFSKESEDPLELIWGGDARASKKIKLWSDLLQAWVEVNESI